MFVPIFLVPAVRVNLSGWKEAPGVREESFAATKAEGIDGRDFWSAALSSRSTVSPLVADGSHCPTMAVRAGNSIEQNTGRSESIVVEPGACEVWINMTILARLV
jgi:hypothetical protein